MSRSEQILASLEMFGVRLGLERIRRLLDRLGQPHLATPVVLIAGTNGKGSTAAMLAAMSRAAGYRTGLYTSPHLESVTERIAVGEQPIADQRLAVYLEQILQTAEADDPPTYFEILTAAAFLHFRDSRAELAVMEVGLGGRLDATNVCEPILSLITSIARDHEHHLGTTLAAIAREKGGILRRGKPAIAWVDGETAATLEAQADELGCDLVLAPSRVRVAPLAGTDDVSSPTVSVRTPEREHLLRLPLLGAHQHRNLSLAVLAAEALAAQGWRRLDETAIALGCQQCRWPGRLERLILASDKRVLLDAAHNPAAIRALCEYLEKSGAETPEEAPDLLFGAMRDKNVAEMLPPVASRCHDLFLTRPRASRAEGPPGSGPRGGDPREWVTLVEPRKDGSRIHVDADPEAALEAALTASSRQLVVCGSSFLTGTVRRLLHQRYGASSSW